ncbi:hypothetical protein [Nostoc sp. ChiQUE01b]|uniref:hypothetical protein n=1 Tax=Nostoc sp. ChiQUE01b TaxID=3075376 RepID=UPI002AD3B80C|nr:hypothetical protein [Nostoc sp. ChiQUE01b]
MMPLNKKDVREFEKASCDARDVAMSTTGYAYALVHKAFKLLAITSLYDLRKIPLKLLLLRFLCASVVRFSVTYA